jgi:hypothetical protein
MFHRVAPIGDEALWAHLMTFSTHATLELRDDEALVVDPDGAVRVTYAASDIRCSLLWRGLTFADAEAERIYDDHLDDLDLATIEGIFREDLAERGEAAPESSDVVHDPEWQSRLNQVYGYISPDIS